MYQFESRKNPMKVYVFDEWRFSGESVERYNLGKDMDARGKVVNTLEISLNPPESAPYISELMTILKDCDNGFIEMGLERNIGQALFYVKVFLDKKALSENREMVHVHTVDTGKTSKTEKARRRGK